MYFNFVRCLGGIHNTFFPPLFVGIRTCNRFVHVPQINNHSHFALSLSLYRLKLLPLFIYLFFWVNAKSLPSYFDIIIIIITFTQKR